MDPFMLHGLIENGAPLLAWGGLALAGIAALGLVAALLDYAHRTVQRETAERIFAQCVAEHLDTLARNRDQKIHIDCYGVVDASEWCREAKYFIDKVIMPHLSDAQARVIRSDLNRYALHLLEKPVHRRCVAIAADCAFDPDMDGYAFERFCAGLLDRAGWTTEVTAASQDQGVDIIATRDGVRVAIQCKKYGGPVGNKAVQEASTARLHARCRHAAVVTNATFTRSASALAQSSSVLLLHYSDLARLDAILAGEQVA
ncbi:restriction endonuclease [Roseospira navarrensis]|uniref:Restriction endonuclease n=1 Tax=Roseospira navarrensis TaxID=140058 RepID=A0A7X2D2D8_9PROT|nr:restriction endonuclease [Roseospira navarrensis]MQX35678.1 restriction endonuclease [Roseospira navarrensis]